MIDAHNKSKNGYKNHLNSYKVLSSILLRQQFAGVRAYSLGGGAALSSYNSC